MLQGFKQPINSSDTELNPRKPKLCILQNQPDSRQCNRLQMWRATPQTAMWVKAAIIFNVKYTIYSKKGNLIDLPCSS